MEQAPVQIVGQGIAGTMLGWACEQRGIEFRIIDRGHEQAASRVGAEGLSTASKIIARTVPRITRATGGVRFRRSRKGSPLSIMILSQIL